MLKTIMNIEEVADYLGFSVKKIYRLVETNQIPASKIGRQYRFIRDTIDNWLKGRDITIKSDWSARLDAVLTRMHRNCTDISLEDINREIKKVRAARSENS